jgi:hypothetical protein
MHSFFIEKKSGLDFIENKFLIASLYLHEMLNSVISTKMLFETYNIDKSSFEHRIYDTKPLKFCITWSLIRRPLDYNVCPYEIN